MRTPHFRIFKFWIPLMILLVVFSQDAPANNGASGVERMVRQIETLFPVLEGYVLSVEGDRVAIDLKRGQSITPGQTLKLIRYGKPITHPVTKKIVGHQETDLGQIQIKEVRKDYSIAQIMTPGVQAQKGDGVRSLFKKVKPHRRSGSGGCRGNGESAGTGPGNRNAAQPPHPFRSPRV